MQSGGSRNYRQNRGRYRAGGQLSTHGFEQKPGRDAAGAASARLAGHRLVPLATALVQEDGRILHWSQEAEALTGWSAEEAIGAHPVRLLLPEQERAAAEKLFDRLVAGRGWSGTHPVRRRDGSTVELEFHTYPVAGPDGRPLLLATASDTDALHEVESDLAVLDGFFDQSPIGLAVYDTDLRFVRLNEALARIRIGTTLDLKRTAEEMVEAIVPKFADFATVDLLEPVLRGEEPAPIQPERSIQVRAVAVGEAYGSGLTTVSDTVGETTEYGAHRVYTQCLRSGRSWCRTWTSSSCAGSWRTRTGSSRGWTPGSTRT
nr:PAS domain S-box protein [Streptomyces sp. Li-HN-5-13]